MISKLKSYGLACLGGIIVLMYFLIGQKNRALRKQAEYMIKRKKEEVKDLGKQKKKILDKVKNTKGDTTKLNIKLVEIEKKAAKIKEEAKSKPKEEK
jgi:predicted ATP-binding protein involved in virulence